MASLGVDIEHALEKPRPGDAGVGSMPVAVLWHRLRLGLWNDQGSALVVWRKDAGKAGQMHSWPGHNRRQALHQLERRHHDVGRADQPGVLLPLTMRPASESCGARSGTFGANFGPQTTFLANPDHSSGLFENVFNFEFRSKEKMM